MAERPGDNSAVTDLLRPLRITVVHGYYSSRVPSGENVVVDLQIAALRAAGHEVQVVARRQDEVETVRAYGAKTALRVATGRGYDPSHEIDEFAPDIVHVHNLFPNFGRAWVAGYADRLVATLHNFRPICVAATLFRDGAECTECPDSGSSLPALRHRCFKDSVLATLPVVAGARMSHDPLLRHARQLIVLNDVMQAHYEAAGVRPDALSVVPNFVDAGRGPVSSGSGPWMFAGRLAPEKGIVELLEQWPVGAPLTIVGDGPLMPRVRELAGPLVDVRGAVSGAEVRSLLADARGLVFPSLWPEGLPTVYLEALSAGTPVLASSRSVVGTLVAHSGTGAVMTADLQTDLKAAEAGFPQLRAHCRRVFEDRYSSAAWLAAVEDLYAGVVREQGSAVKRGRAI